MSSRTPAARASYGEGVGFGALGFVSVAFVSVFSSFLIARLYGVQAIGEFALVMAPSSVLWLLSSAREQAALVRELSGLEPRSPRITGLFTAVMAFSFGLTAVVSVPVLVGTYFLYAGPIDHPSLFLPALVNIAGYLLFTNTCWNADMVFTAFRAGRVLFWLRLHQVLANVVFAVGLSFAFDSVWGLTIATAASWATGLVHRLFVIGDYMPWSVPRAEIRDGFRTLPDLLRFGIRIVPGTISDGVSQEVSTWVLGIVVSVSSVGAFSRAWLLSRRLVDLNYRITEMLFPTLVERHGAGDQEGFDRALVDTLRLACSGLLLPAAVGGGAAIGIMDLFGPGFGEASTALALVLLVPALSLVSQAQAHALMAVNRPLTTSKVSIVRMVVTVAACIALVHVAGITGAGIAILAGYGVDLTIRFHIARGLLHRPLSHLWPLRSMVAMAGAYACGFGVARVIDVELDGLPGVLLALIAGCTAYGAALVLLGGVLARDRDGLRAILERVAPRIPLRTPVSAASETRV